MTNAGIETTNIGVVNFQCHNTTFGFYTVKIDAINAKRSGNLSTKKVVL